MAAKNVFLKVDGKTPNEYFYYWYKNEMSKLIDLWFETNDIQWDLHSLNEMFKWIAFNSLIIIKPLNKRLTMWNLFRLISLLSFTIISRSWLIFFTSVLKRTVFRWPDGKKKLVGSNQVIELAIQLYHACQSTSNSTIVVNNSYYFWKNYQISN